MENWIYRNFYEIEGGFKQIEKLVKKQKKFNRSVTMFTVLTAINFMLITQVGKKHNDAIAEMKQEIEELKNMEGE